MASSEFPTVELSRLLYSTSRLLIQQIQLALNEFGLTYPQFLVLSILWKEDGFSDSLIMKASGHSSSEMVHRYDRTDIADNVTSKSYLL